MKDSKKYKLGQYSSSMRQYDQPDCSCPGSTMISRVYTTLVINILNITLNKRYGSQSSMSL